MLPNLIRIRNKKADINSINAKLSAVKRHHSTYTAYLL
jgi:hypothetical protein